MSPDRERASAGDSNSAVQRRRKRIWIDLTISEFGCFQPTQIQTRPLRLFEFNLVNIIDFHKDCHKDKKTASIACSKLIRHAIGKTAFLQRPGASDKIERLSVRRWFRAIDFGRLHHVIARQFLLSLWKSETTQAADRSQTVPGHAIFTLLSPDMIQLNSIGIYYQKRNLIKASLVRSLAKRQISATSFCFVETEDTVGIIKTRKNSLYQVALNLPNLNLRNTN